ncbi:hypothetical protein [Streptococcus equinus]|uniref:Uncharacterized protein n=1 Tax=Streptococcus equinus TaxID=1335 RepID=A0AAE8HKP2_STREI|nr:hypothetical protein [Streptococcus equinus]SDW51735.1 hypothetical protein SAMN05216415_0885 [Streptococcus equinus]
MAEDEKVDNTENNIKLLEAVSFGIIILTFFSKVGGYNEDALCFGIINYLIILVVMIVIFGKAEIDTFFKINFEEITKFILGVSVSTILLFISENEKFEYPYNYIIAILIFISFILWIVWIVINLFRLRDNSLYLKIVLLTWIALFMDLSTPLLLAVAIFMKLKDSISKLNPIVPLLTKYILLFFILSIILSIIVIIFWRRKFEKER